MHDGNYAGHWLEGTSLARFEGFGEAGWPRVVCEDGTLLDARSLVPLGPTDQGREVATAPLHHGIRLILGFVQPERLPVPTEKDVQIIEAGERLELRCGPASIVLFSDGRVEVRGTQVLSRSDGANRIQGATVLLN